jgi:ABC-type uncharacterized transport system permease subunit
VRWALIVGVVLSAVVGLFVAAFLDTYLSDDWVRGIVSCVIGVAVAVSLGRNVVTRHGGHSMSRPEPEGD